MEARRKCRSGDTVRKATIGEALPRKQVTEQVEFPTFECNYLSEGGLPNQIWFRSIEEAKQEIDQWRHHYNHERPHSPLKYMTPGAFANKAA